MKNFLTFVICGKFHYGAYLSYLDKRQELAKVYFSHDIRNTMGVSRIRRTNLFVKEYVLTAGLRLLAGRFRSMLIALSHALWSVSLYIYFRPSRINIFLLHGNCEYAIRRAKAGGKLVVGEAVNLHPFELTKILNLEAGKCGIRVAPVEKAQQIAREAALVDYILCPSAAIADSYLRQGISANRLIVLGYGVSNPPLSRDVQRASRWPPRLGPIKMLTVGQLIVRKGQHLLLNYVKRWNAEHPGRVIELTLIGKGDPSYREFLQSMEVEYTYVPHLPNDELIELMGDFDVLVTPSIEDGFGIVVTEAVSAGVPVLVSKNAGASEFIERYGGGCAYDYDRYESFASQLKQVLAGKFRQVDAVAATWEDYSIRLVENLSALKKPPKGL